MKYTIMLLLLLIFTTVYPQQKTAQQGNKKIFNAQFVNPFIGTGGHGHTYPGATLPFGMVQLSPDTRIDGSWDGCSGYHYSDSIIYGFSHTHLSGTGCSDYGDISLMPAIGNVTHQPTSYAAAFQHKNENAMAGLYTVKLNNNIEVRLTASKRAGMHEYRFPAGDMPQLVIDLEHRDKALDYMIKIINDSTIVGFRISEAWAKKQEIYFCLQLNHKIEDYTWLIHDSITPTTAIKTGKITGGHFGKMLLRFKNLKNGAVKVKVGISSVSTEGATNNLLNEIPHWNFEQIKNEAFDAWNQELGKIEIEQTTIEKKKIFYTALYHCMLQPNIYNDVDGRYRGRDGNIHTAEGFDYYSVFSLWDTFRAWHPLMSIIDRKRTLDFIKTFLAQYQQGGLLPVWELSCNETECMIGYHSVSVIADAISKGINDFNLPLAYEAMKKSAESKQRFGIGKYMSNGALSIEDESESVSKTLEYAYDDWCIAQVAKQLGYNNDYQEYMKRSQSWKNLFDSGNKFIRPKKNGDFLTPFDPYEVNNHFTEANAWQYTFFMPHDIPGMVNAYGGTKGFTDKLDSLFTTKSKTSGREQADITGLIGQYAHGNEPSHHIAWLYNSIGNSVNTADRVHQILNDFYLNSPDGLIGNEDCGQMSAWYVLSAMGIYQICPGRPEFEFNRPLFNAVTINLEEKRKLLIYNLSKNTKGKYIRKINAPYHIDPMQLSFSDITTGGTLTYFTTNSPDSACNKTQRKYQPVEEENLIVINPIIHTVKNPFIKETECSITASKNAVVYYTTNGQEPNIESNKYIGPIQITNSTTVKAIAVSNGKASKTVTAKIHQLPHPDWSVKLNCQYNRQYTAGGDAGIIDGLNGDTDWRKGGWQGYQAQDVDIIIQLNEVKEITEISANFLQDTRSWILMPTSVSFEYSEDGTTYKQAGQVQNTLAADHYPITTKTFTQQLKPVKAKFIKVKALNFGKLPTWHAGAGGEAFIFIDEITVK
jgi:predicted alpha-1,2-mannosidase